MAKHNNVYLAAHLITATPCDKSDPNCPHDGQYSYNTAVAFDREGRFILKYNKIHLFFEATNNTPKKDQLPAFDTDFGRFGIGICFDSMFRFPLVDMVEKAGITHILFPTYWYDDTLTPALAWQQGWAAMMGVNFIAANLHDVKVTTGSGLFSGRRVLGFIHGRPGLVVAKMPAKPFKGMNSKSHYVPHVSYKPVKHVISTTSERKALSWLHSQLWGGHLDFSPLIHREDNLRVCKDGFCCNLSYKIKENPNKEIFIFGASSGLSVIKEDTYYPKAKLHLVDRLYTQACVLMKCEGDSAEKCGKLTKTGTTKFAHFSMEGEFQGHHIFPAVLTTGMEPANHREWNFAPGQIWSKHGPSKPLIHAVLFERLYHKDKLDPKQP